MKRRGEGRATGKGFFMGKAYSYLKQNLYKKEKEHTRLEQQQQRLTVGRIWNTIFK